MKLCPSSLFSFFLFLLLIPIFLVVTFLTSTAYSEIAATYEGPTETHLQYNYNADGAGDLGVKLVAVLSDESEIMLDPESGSYGPLSFSGKLRHGNLVRRGQYRYELRVVYRETPEAPIQERTVETTWAVLDDTASGTMLFDEVLDGDSLGLIPMSIGSITVSEGTELQITGATLLTGSSITVKGTIAISPMADTHSIKIYIESPQNFPEINNARLSFASSSSGSVIEKGSSLRVTHVGGDLTINNITELVIEQLPIQPGTLTLNHIKPWYADNLAIAGKSRIFLSSGINLVFKDVEMAYPKDTTYSQFYFELREEGSFLFEDCVLFKKISMGIYGNSTNNITFRRTKFRSGIAVIGGEPVFESCEFGGDVSLYNRNAASFVKNIFSGALKFINSTNHTGDAWNADGDEPFIDQNSFVGPEALIYNDVCSFVDPVPYPISIESSNYFGDIYGYVKKFDPCAPNVPDRFLVKRGALVTDMATSGQVFDIDGYASSRTGVKTDKGVLPRFWLINSIIGQNTIPHVDTLPASPMLQGRETLICLDLATTDDMGVSNLKIFAKVDDTVVKSTTIPILRREAASYSKNGSIVTLVGASTVNFILPPIDKAQAKVEIFLDASEIEGYDIDGDGEDDPGPGALRLLTKTLNFDPPYSRKLNVLFHTVEIEKEPLSIEMSKYTRTNALTRTRKALLSYLPAMLPIGSKDLALYPLPDQRAFSQALTTTGLLLDLAPGLEVARRLYEHKNNIDIDFQVAILPAGSLGKEISGANFSILRKILFVDEAKLTAILHEMGHGLGMYRVEQYDLFPPDGEDVESVTAFINEPGISIEWMGGIRRRVFHILAHDHKWYKNQDWMDIMSKSDYPVWTIPSTLQGFYQGFRGLLGTAASQSDLTRSPMEETAGIRVLLYGKTLRTIEGEEYIYRIQPETLQAIAIDPAMMGSLPPDTSGPGELHRIIAFDLDENQVFSQDFFVNRTNPYSGEVSSDEDIWYGTFDLPETAHHYTLTRVPDNRLLLHIQPAPHLSCDILTPESGTTLGERVRIEWKATPEDDMNQPIRNMLFFSLDGGSSWQPSSLFQRGTKADISTEFMRNADDISIRVIASDGIQYMMAQADNLSVENRNPVVTILSPQEGDAAGPDLGWTLWADVLDVEDDGILQGNWVSSIDGELGDESFIEEVKLSIGNHILTYTVMDSSGAGASASVHVTVGEVTDIDLFFKEDALKITPPGTDPVYTPIPTVIKPGQSHSATVRLRNGGAAGTCDLGLYLINPNGSENLIASQSAVAMDPFEEVVLHTLFVPEGNGQFRFRAVVSNSLIQDPEPDNDERSWTYYSSSTQIVILSPNGGESWRAGNPQQISWNYSGFAGTDVKIELLDGDVPVRVLTDSTPIGMDGTGCFEWTMHRDLSAGTDYRIRVTSLSDETIFGQSEAAFITLFPDPVLADAITILMQMAGLHVSSDELKCIQDVGDDGFIGLPEAIYTLQSVAGINLHQ